MHIYTEIKNGNISIEKIEKGQNQFKSKLNEITIGNPKGKSKDQLGTIKNNKNLYNSRDKVIKLYNDYVKILPEAIYKTEQGTRLKILIPKQMLHVVLHADSSSRVKADNSSENLLNEIRQIVYSL